MTLLSGFEEIARQSEYIAKGSTMKPSDVASEVLCWLNSQTNWLLVLDNLDDFGVVDGYLPCTSSGHTLITTRDQHYDQIPAEGLEIGLLDMDDAVNLLLTRCGLAPSSATLNEVPDSIRLTRVTEEIVQELGMLPLAIEQAAAYIREATKDIFKFLECYKQNRKAHHARLPKGMRNYYTKSVATTWRLSFESIERNNPDASKLLQLLAFLNPDGILIEFLEAGVGGLDNELREIAASSLRLFEALAELERFSLIGRKTSHSRQRITVHRLVQQVVKDEMSSEQYESMVRTIISFCDSAFPQWHDWDQSLLQLSRLYEDQVVGPVSAVPTIADEAFSSLLVRIGLFLREDGKYQQATEMLKKGLSVKQAHKENELQISQTKAMLVWCYLCQALYHKAIELEEEVVETRRLILGTDVVKHWSQWQIWQGCTE